MCTCNDPTSNARTARRETWNGRSFLIAPFVSLTEGVLSGSNGALLYLSEDIEANPGQWNGAPITVGHPLDPITNAPQSAADPEVRNRTQIGVVRKDRAANGKRTGGAYFDVERTKRLAPTVYQRLLNGQPISLSTGVHIDAELTPGTYNGREYRAIARNLRPDHLAILPDTKGACDFEAGCGVFLNQKPKGKVMEPQAVYGPRIDTDMYRGGRRAGRPIAAAGVELGHGFDSRI
jgi:hypothetical protein